jgi:hypothetical protein
VSRTFLTPILLPADPTVALEAATKQYVDAVGAGGIGTVNSFTFNSSTTEPPTGNQIRLNNATQSSATLLWISQTTFDGLDISIGLSRITTDYQIYIQDFDDSTKWILFNATGNGTDKGSYWEIPVSYSAGPANLPTQKVALQTITPANHGIPPGGSDNQVLTKTSGSDYAVAWETPDATQAELDAKVPTTRAINTSTPLMGGGLLNGDLDLEIAQFTDAAPGAVPPFGTESGQYLRDDGTWHIPIVAVADASWPPASPDADTLYLHLAP